MQRLKSLPLSLLLLLALAAAALLFNLAPRLTGLLDGSSRRVAPDGSETVAARVVAVLDTGVVESAGVARPYQIVRVEAIAPPWAGEPFTIDFGRTNVAAPGVALAAGDRILITITQDAQGDLLAYFADFQRTRGLLLLASLFVIAIVLLSGWKGVRSLISMVISFAVIVGFILPNILAGANPVAVSTAGAFVILAVTLYLVYGWTLKTHAAVISVLIALTITGLLAYYFINLLFLTGLGSEEAVFLSQQAGVRIDLRGLVLSGILIGALGVLDDLVITQASAVFELRVANPSLTFAPLYRQSMRIGQDHVAATVNTLVLAYTGAALPLLLLVTQGGEQFGAFVNREFVTEEIVRTLVGSLGLIAAVPITTGLAAMLVLHHDRLGRLRPLLGLVSSGGHDHHHHH